MAASARKKNTNPIAPQDDPSRPAFPWATVAVSLAAIGLMAWPGAVSALAYERTRIEAGDYWRLWTAHVVHFGWLHLFWNLAVFLPAGIWAERLVPDRYRLLLVLGPAFIGFALYGLDPSLVRYVGLSGVAAAVLTFLALTQVRRGTADRWFWRTVLLLVAAKIGLEFAASSPLLTRFDQPGVHTVPLAHASGALAAIFVHSGWRRRR